MIQIRSCVFETNSSSTHSICIPKKTKHTVNSVSFEIGEFGWENASVDPASYLYTAILYIYGYEGYQEKIDMLVDILNRNNISYRFEKPKWFTSKYDNRKYLDEGYIDHGYDALDFVESVLHDEDMLLRYLSCGEVYTGNDNQEAQPSGCDIAWDDYYDDDSGEYVPNPYHDEENYDYFYKRN